MPTPVIIGGIDCAVESQTESWPESGPQAVVTFKVPWEHRYTVANALMGTATLDASGAVIRTPPFLYPRANPEANIRCVSIGQIEPRGNPRQTADDGMLDFDWAFMAVQFGVLRYQVEHGDPAAGHRDPSGLAYTVSRSKNSAELFTPPGKSYYTVYDEKPVPESALALIRPRIEISMTRLYMPYVPVAESMEFLQAVNDDVIRFGNREFPRGCLMYCGMQDEDAGDPLGRPLFNITYTLLGNHSVEWNEIYKESDWRLINSMADGTGEWPFPYIAFDNAELPNLLSGFPA